MLCWSSHRLANALIEAKSTGECLVLASHGIRSAFDILIRLVMLLKVIQHRLNASVTVEENVNRIRRAFDILIRLVILLKVTQHGLNASAIVEKNVNLQGNV
ncbi:hypothetical protein QYM36_004467 [Artemia franciscana]|uniref:Uncharacterized protein n=1 Tax=Artemia franciscana TaxID=6661 RepID=A0AA88IEZ8_ARTSF|nr:hypothetical protein QYM36_004467 [Artemia franciscana]